MATKHWITRVRTGKQSYTYYNNSEPVTTKEEVTYFTSLRIPPAWKDVQIARNKRSKIVATGTDKAGRRQYIYHPAFRARQEQAKFERILRFARALPHMRDVTGQQLRTQGFTKQKVLACAVRVLDEAYLRVGNEVYAAENQSYGLTTLRSKHTTVKGDVITFDFIGKSGKQQHKQITDRTLARIVRQLDELPGREVFKYIDGQGSRHRLTSADVNAYIKEIMGDEFSAKDFRTWAGTLIATAELVQAERPDTDNARKKMVTTCVKNVAKRLGNTPAVARSSYIDPRVIDAYMHGRELRELRESLAAIQHEQHLSNDERCVLTILEDEKQKKQTSKSVTFLKPNVSL